jgi:hypothetical protein
MSAALLLELVALVGGTVHSLEPGVEPATATLLVRDGRIEALLAPDVAPPPEARRIDVAGKHVVPGLIDGLTYFDPAHDALYVSHGITTIRDLGGDPVRALLGREPAQRDRVPGPALLTAAAVVDGDPPSSSEALILRTPEMADELLPILFNEEVDLISVQLGLPREPFLRTLELAHAQGLEVWGPVPRGMTLSEALAAGQDGVLFLDRLLPEGVPWEKVLPGGLKPGIEALRASGAALVPVLYASELRARLQTDEDADFALLDPLYEAQWKAEREFRARLFDETYAKAGVRVAAKQAELLLALRAAGVPLLPGSAAPLPWLMPGDALHRELALWERAGVPPADVLAAATRGAAEILGIADERGRLAPGLVADVLVLGADPRVSVAALRAPELLLVRGHVLDAETLRDRLATLAAGLAEERASLARPIEVEAPHTPSGACVLQGRVEVQSLSQSIRAERFAVVREPDGALAYCGRTAYRSAKGEPARRMDVLQRTRDGKLDEFVVELWNGPESVRTHGLWVADELRIEREIQGAKVGIKRVRERVGCIDIGSVTSALLLGQLVRSEPFQVVSFHELLEPELALWSMEYRGEGVLTHYVRTHKGAFAFRNTEKGSVAFLRNQVGGGTLETVLVEEDALGGAGLPLPPEKLAAVKAGPVVPAVGDDAGSGGGR